MDPLNADDPELRARARFYYIGAMRLAGAFMVMAGMIIAAGRWPLVDPDTDRIIGAVIAILGFADFFIVPILLARRWKSPPQ